MRAKVEAAGLTNSMGLLLRKELEDLPPVITLQDRMRLRQDVISDLQYQMIVRGEERSRSGDIEGGLALLLKSAGNRTPEELADFARVGRELLTKRRDLLSALLDDYEKLFARLVELDTATRQAIDAVQSYRGFVEERILWVRSVTGKAMPDLGESLGALAWLLDGASWRAGLASSWDEVQRRWLEVLLGGIAILLVVLSRFWSRGRVRGMAAVVERESGDTFTYTVQALGMVLLRATAFPALIWGAGWVLSTPPRQPEVVLAAAKGLNAAAFAFFSYELLRQVLLKDSMGEAHFRWSPQVCQHIRWHLHWFIPVKLLCVFLVTTLDVQRQSDLWNDSLGRIAFGLGGLSLAAFCQRVLRPTGPVFLSYLLENREGWLSRLRYIWYPLAVGLPIVLVLTALRGYYFTALQLDARLQAWLWFAMVLVLVNALFLRWLRVVGRRLAVEPEASAPAGIEPQGGLSPALQASPDPVPSSPGAAEKTVAAGPSEIEPEASEAPGEDEVASRAREFGVELAPDDNRRLKLPEVNAQTRHLFQSAIVLTVLIGTYMIWADVLPALKRLDQIQVYPEFGIIEVPSGQGSLADAAAPGAQTGRHVVTLAGLGLAILVFVFTVVAAQNVPGLLEILVFSKLPLDPGGRYAAITLARYLILLIGIPMALSRVGITWESVQWLAAAFTFGLAFGLQEIFANFISGLIILFERPVRVGDLVTIQGTSGVVSKIRMRATTITDFDRKELIVPNKQFVTGNVLNWALSDEIIRVVIPVSVAYGGDVERVRELLLKVAREHALVIAEPAPSCFFTSLGDSAINFDLRVFVAKSKDKMTVQHEVLRRVYEELAAARIEIPFPQRDLHIRSADPIVDALREARRGGSDAPGPDSRQP